MSTPSRQRSPLHQSLEQQLKQLHQQLALADLSALARASGFLQRLPRKIPVAQWVLALVALAVESVLSLERVAAVISLTAGTAYSKQALHQRLGVRLERFLAQVATTLLHQLGQPLHQQGCFASFQRVLLQDSTVESLPNHLAEAFPGPANGRRAKSASLKIQFICDLLNSQVVHLSLSGFRRNDQAASPDILTVAQAGDLIIRDLGYFVLKVFAQLALRGAYFLSRFRQDVGVYDPASGQPLNLAQLLRPGQSLDRAVLLGEQKVPARLVAVPVSETLANERRRKARQNRDRRLNPRPDKLYLLGWNIFVTNISAAVWSAKVFQPVYRLRWRIEMIFKAWKSHLRLRELNCRSASLLRLSVWTKLLFCIAVYRCCDALELRGDGQQHVSLLRLARILGQCACWFAVCFLGVSVSKWLEWHLRCHLFYERRKDRKNFYELLAELQPSLT